MSKAAAFKTVAVSSAEKTQNSHSFMVAGNVFQGTKAESRNLKVDDINTHCRTQDPKLCHEVPTSSCFQRIRTR